jgi:hypothetical protein
VQWNAIERAMIRGCRANCPPAQNPQPRPRNSRIVGAVHAAGESATAASAHDMVARVRPDDREWRALHHFQFDSLHAVSSLWPAADARSRRGRIAGPLLTLPERRESSGICLFEQPNGSQAGARHPAIATRSGWRARGGQMSLILACRNYGRRMHARSTGRSPCAIAPLARAGDADANCRGRD